MNRITLLRGAVLAGLLGAPLLALPLPAAAFVSVGISVGIAPPPLPLYVQPYSPGSGFIWMPGYWGWDGYQYYWVPGTWVEPPEIGLLWTPGWWGWDSGYYRWYPGYWGPRVGFYGGINYGCGYFGVGYVGGYWRGGHFWYNRAVNHINVTNIHTVYTDKTVVNNEHSAAMTRVSYNGGHGGVSARPTPAQLAAAHERHFGPTPAQTRQSELAMNNPAQRFSVNHGRPAIVATPRPGNFASPHAIRNESTMAAPRAGVTTSHGASMAPPADGFVHAPHANAAMSTRRSQPSEHMQPHEQGFAPQRGELMPSRTETMPPRNGYERQQVPPPAAQRGPEAYGAPHQGHAPPMHNTNRAPQPHDPKHASQQDHQDDHGH